MLGDIVDIIVKIAEVFDKNSHTEEIVKSIDFSKKYDKRTIAAAYSWIHEKSLRDLLTKKEIEKAASGTRIFSKAEVDSIGSDNINYLLHFFNIGVINKFELEIIIERLMLFPTERVNFDFINILLLSLFLNLDAFLLPGSRAMLYSSDKIN
jgi:uncharacterized protein Smg (DUF494 family)